MSDKKPPKNVGGIAAGITMAASVIPLVKPAIDMAREQIDKVAENRKRLVAVPELYSKGFPLTTEQAMKLLGELGFKFELVKLSLKEVNVKYRDCFDSQVIETHPKAKQKVEPGSSVLIKYITQEVIDESQRLFDEVEKRKVQLSLEKATKRSERKEKTKQVMADVIGTAKRGVENIPSILHKKKYSEEEQDE